MTKNEAIFWETVSAILDAIKESGSTGLPSGHLYATLTGMMSLETYQGIINLLVKGNKITEEHHLLKAI